MKKAVYNFHRSKPRLLFFLFVLVMGCPVVGQLAKKQLTEADYKLWHQMTLQQVSADGKWVQYGLVYQDADSIIIKKVDGTKKYGFSHAQQPVFFSDHYFSCISDKLLTVIDLNNDVKKVYKDVKRYEIIGSLLTVYGGDKALTLYDRVGQTIMKEQQVSSFSVPQSGEKLAFISHSEMGDVLRTFDSGSLKTIDGGTGIGISNLTYKEDGKALFYIKGMAGKPEFHCVANGIDHVLASPELQDKMSIAAEMQITFSADGKRVFYYVRERNVKQENAVVQVWNTKDRWLYSKDQDVLGYHGVPLLAVWNIEKEVARVLGSVELPNGLLNGDQNYVINYHPEANPDTFHFPKEQDLYLSNIQTGHSQIWISGFDGLGAHLQFSPDGRFAAYFKDKQWFVYEFKNQVTYAATRLIPSNLEMHTDILATEDAFGLAGWSNDGNNLLLYDAFDVWSVAANGTKAQRLTDGREHGITYRIIPRSKDERTHYNQQSYIGGNFKLENGLLLQGTTSNYDRSFIAFWKGKKLKRIYATENKIRNIKAVADGLLFGEENQALSPRIIKVDKNGKTSIITESNLQQKQFAWGKMEVLDYTGSKGKTLHGLLFYPAHYDAEKKYPMVVQVYDQMLKNRQLYVNPSLYNSIGFNRTNLCAKGYFVLMPDIDYDTHGGVSQHALTCVKAAIGQALLQGSIDRQKIGLIGHSFGGYETALLITQTKLFACAVAGAAVTDIVSSYMLEAKNQKVPNYFRNEALQYHLGATLWDARESYLQNSPVYNADKIETPLLSWTGSLDGQVQPSQSTELYFAMRRLGKTNIMLVYTEEEHGLDGIEADADLTRKVEEWFGHYLKDRPLPDWMKAR